MRSAMAIASSIESAKSVSVARGRLRYQCKRGDAGRAAGLIDLADAETVADVVELLARGGCGRGGDDELAYAGNARGDRAHDQRRDVHRASAGNVHANAAQRTHAM